MCVDFDVEEGCVVLDKFIVEVELLFKEEMFVFFGFNYVLMMFFGYGYGSGVYRVDLSV